MSLCSITPFVFIVFLICFFLLVSLVVCSKFQFFLFVQPNIFVHCWRSYCRNFRIYWLHWLHILFSCYGNYFSRTHGQGKVFSALILWFLEPCHPWRLPGWANGTQFYSLLILVHFISIINCHQFLWYWSHSLHAYDLLVDSLSSSTALPLIFWKVYYAFKTMND